MNNSTHESPPVAYTHAPILLLKQAREARGMDIALLASAMKVPAKKLEALEAGRFDELPGLTFARALASSACRHLKIDAGPVLDQIPVAEKPQLGSADTAMETPFSSSLQSRFQPSLLLSKPALLSSLVLLAAALLVAWWPADGTLSEWLPAASDEKSLALPADSAAPRDSPIKTPEAVVEAVATYPSTTQATASATEPQMPPAGMEPAATVTAKAVAETPVPKPGSVMTIRAVSQSWVEVTNSSGKFLFRGTVEAGDVVNFVSAPPYSVLLGRYEAAEVTVRGQRFDPTPFARNSVARFEVR